MNTPTILCFAILGISNIALWTTTSFQLKWNKITDEQLYVLYERDKRLAEEHKYHQFEHKLNLNKVYGKMVTETNCYKDTDSVKEGENNAT